ncbi:MAG: hypothetical protein HYY51_00995 [Candidatus Magasanikbacteria bacterium]|nr:hypothetical protein [Candidatus Magasanikbacteria bacterium]
MADYFKSIFLNLISSLFGEEYRLALYEKAESVLWAGLILTLATILFCLVYHHFFWKEKETRQIFYYSMFLMFLVVLGKYVLSLSYKGYIADRLIMYALPSPQILAPWWVLYTVFIVFLFFAFRKYFKKWKIWPYLAVLAFVFTLFSLGINGMRSGWASVTDSLSRSYWEYTGYLPHIENTKSFLHDYVATVSDPDLSYARHSSTHPPGYILFLYGLRQFFKFEYPGVAIVLALVSGLSVFPIYLFWREFMDENDLRSSLQLFIFFPGLVLMSVSSLEAFFLFITWLSLGLCLKGWKSSRIGSAFGGLAAAFALFSNFLFLLVAPVFLYMLWHIWQKHYKNNPTRSAYDFSLNLSLGLVFFLSFFAFLYVSTGYSILENFLAARGANSETVQSNFSSLGIYVVFFLMNILAFAIAMGIAHISGFFQRFRDKNKTARHYHYIGYVFVLFLLAIGIFQGEVGRLWLFVFPLFLPVLSSMIKQESETKSASLLCLLIFQSFAFQILFYTYW